MKKIVLVLFLAALSVACKNNDHGDANLHITGTVKGLKQGKLYIKKIVDTWQRDNGSRNTANQ